MELSYRAAEVEDELKRLRDDDAIELICNHVLGGGEVGHNRLIRIRRIDIKQSGMGNSGAKCRRVSTILHFEHAAADIGCVVMKELLDVVTVDRRAALHPPVRAQRCGSVEPPKPGGTNQARHSLADT